ncbi:hypothetical protein [Streptomyces sp. KR80]|uniref:hypothetical protein n=1 Tax=Streptomyces sp. KR80 TaxID=3457426 RepID=UPI003FD2D371
MTTPTTPRKRTPAGKAKAPSRRAGTSTKKPPAKSSTTAKASESGARRTITITVPDVGRVASGAANAAMLPVAVARQVLPAKGGLPLYVGLGVLGAADVLDWPVAFGIGIGYAVLRRSGSLAPAPGQG